MLKASVVMLILLPLWSASCGPVPASEASILQPSLNWHAAAGNNVLYSTNSNVKLQLWLERPGASPDLNGNVVISAGRGGDSVFPTHGVVTGGSEMGVVLRVGVSGKASVTAKTAELSQTFEVDVASADAVKSSLAFEPNTVVAGEQAAQATLWAQDAQGRNITGVSAQVTTDEPTTRLLPEAVQTQASGRGVFNILPTRAGTHTITVRGENISYDKTLTVKPAGIDDVKSTVVLAPNPCPADGVTPMTVTVTVSDAYGNPVAERPVTLTSSMKASPPSPVQGQSDATGKFTAVLRSALAGTVTVTALVYPKSSSPVTLKGQAAFVAGP